MNKLFKYAMTLFVAVGILSCSGGKTVKADYGIIPLPQEVTVMDGNQGFILKPSSKIAYPEGNEQMATIARFLASYIQESTGYAPKVEAGTSGDICLVLDGTIQNPESYRLTVSAEGIHLAGATEAAAFYGVQTLRKSIPAEATNLNIELPAATINDYPRFKYRGMMLDVSRHFLPTDSVKAFIDMLALHNLNTLHWHLTDDQGWRIEIKKYPKLTEIGSKRKETVIGRNSGQYDGKEYGGFYTQDEIRDVVAYAAQRHVTIIPEIDMPGHQQAALAAYPDMGCTGGPYEVWTEWGVSDNVVCAGNEQSMQFLEDVLTEVIDLFPSEYIHIGGDECPKVRWAACPKCQARIKAEGLKGDKKHTKEEYLQSYVINRMGKFVESKGRKFIGWDEILEGGLAPGATVMSWRGMEGGLEAAKQHHDAIMTPSTPLYFDYYQSTDTENDPLAIGGYNPLEKVYAFEPVPAELTKDEERYIIGVQANLWREYIPTLSHVEFMVLPRLAALAEVQWTEPAKKDYKSFLTRLMRMTALYDRLGYNYAKHMYDIRATFTPDTENGQIIVALSTLGEGDIYYTLDGSEPSASTSKYETPLNIKENGVLNAMVIRPNGTKSRVFTEKITFGKSTAKPITLKEAPSRGYSFTGGPELTDGLTGNDNYKTGRWLGFQGKDLDAIIDLKEPMEFSKISFNTNVVPGDWIMGAGGVTVKVSDDGTTFREVASKKIPEPAQGYDSAVIPEEITFTPVKARYVEVIIQSRKLPSWHTGAGNPAYVFVDEITVE